MIAVRHACARCDQDATRIHNGLFLCEADYALALGPIEHRPDQDYDRHLVKIGRRGCDASPDHERIPAAEFQLERGVSLANRDRSDGWKYAELSIYNEGAKVCLQGFTVDDLDDLARFFGDYAERLRNW